MIAALLLPLLLAGPDVAPPPEPIRYTFIVDAPPADVWRAVRAHEGDRRRRGHALAGEPEVTAR